MVQNIFVLGATGNVGKELVSQIIQRRDTDYSIHVNPTRIVGLASSESYIFSEEGLSEDIVYSFSEKKTDLGKSFKNIFEFINCTENFWKSNSLVFVDVTALKGEEISKFHLKVLEETTANIVTANKNPISLEGFSLFQKLTQDPIRYGYRCTVMAGADTVSLVQDLRDLSDSIKSLSGCFSGTIGFITSELDKGKKFSEIVKSAKEQGYTEPHPRDDLNGLDVARKLLILARGFGLDLQIEDVNVEPLAPKTLLDNDNIESFLSSLSSIDKNYEIKVQKALKNNNTLRYVAEIIFDKEKVCLNVSLKEVPKNSPLGSLSGPLNKIVVESDYYYPQYAIEAPGAGPKVTASNIRRNLLYSLVDRKFLIK